MAKGKIDMEKLARIEKLYTTHEVAAYLDMNIETLRRWLREGTIKGYKLPSRAGGWRIPESELKRILTGHE